MPCDLELAQFETTTLLTGPNSGGKTRLLQAVRSVIGVNDPYTVRQACLAMEQMGVEVEVHHGGQPLYPYCFGAE